VAARCRLWWLAGFILQFLTGGILDAAPPRTPHRIAVISPLSTSSSEFGKWVHSGVLLSLKDELIADQPIEILERDDASSPATARSLVAQLAEDGVIAIIGPMESHTAAAAIPEADRCRIPLVSPGATADYLTESGSKWFFRAITADKIKTTELADWLHERYAERAVGIAHEIRTRAQPDTPMLYGEAASMQMAKRLKELKQPFVLIPYVRDTLDDAERTAISARLADSKLAAVAILGRSVDTFGIAQWLRRDSLLIPVFLISPDKSLYSQNDVIHDNVFAVSHTLIENAANVDLRTFWTTFKAQQGGGEIRFEQYAAFAYDAGKIVTAAMREVYKKTHPASIEEYRTLLRDELERTPNQRDGLISVGGFTSSRELYFKPQRIELVQNQWQAASIIGGESGAPTYVPRSNAVRTTLEIAAVVAVLLTAAIFIVRRRFARLQGSSARASGTAREAREAHPGVDEGREYYGTASSPSSQSLSNDQPHDLSNIPPKVFVSYSHDSRAHADRVLALADDLRADGIEAILDQYEEFGPAEGWVRWMMRQIDEADFVLMICTRPYCARVTGTETAGSGKGVKWEALLSLQDLYDGNTLNQKFLPVLFDDGREEDIPKPLRSFSHYRLDGDGYIKLYRRLTGQREVTAPDVGKLKALPKRERRPGFFSNRAQNEPSRSGGEFEGSAGL
jgi:hypothetical protein